MMFRFFSAAALFVAACLPAQAFETRATAAWVYDVTTHTVLMDKNGEASLPPASMSKLMTVNMLFEALKDGRIAMDTTFGVSAHAVSFTEAGGSTMYLQQGDRPTVEDLIKGIIINSGNDACVVVAEGLSGTEAAFSEQMTERGKALGLEHSNFVNASGWPAPGHRMSMKDLGLLSVRLIEEFPELYKVFGETDFNYKNRAPANSRNRNPLLALNIGADGLKTGHTQEAGFGMVGSVKQGERRIVFAISGMTSDTERAEEAERIATWAFRQFALKTVVKAGAQVAQAAVFMGEADTIGLVPAEDVKLLIPALAQDGLQAQVVYTGPLEAPIAKGTEVAQLVITVPGLPEHRVGLLAETDVPKGGFMKRLTTAALKLRAEYIGTPAS
ncbi:MAG: D-alanyl-D-alanine carboxypeptidase family protein [Cypionkella sp.]|uniref:D-alanyl-D-alanine carboxypeptidase family protein n=1 Tax=Cypionkella sp. TaxID=2811411 RepID=UPI002ABAB700|nr:D-alanyl-D-alanine carboxypeptidase family protein [Cypionkella sp.]MDZ4311281.1 D-alanyl-D-alanine carboxypeptidase family protein [Cypionkella sp.]